MIDWKSIALFSGLSEDDYSLLKSESSHKSYENNELVFSAGEAPSYLYLVESGRVKLFNRRKGTGKEETVCMITSGGFFCLSPVLNQDPLHINAKTLKTTEITLLPHQVLKDLIDHSHHFSKQIIHFLAKKECELCEEVCDLSLSTTKERLAKFLLNEYINAGKIAPIPLDITQSDLAAFLGTVRETVSRDFSDLKKAGVIDFERKHFSVKSPDELAQIASGARESLPVLSS